MLLKLTVCIACVLHRVKDADYLGTICGHALVRLNLLHGHDRTVLQCFVIITKICALQGAVAWHLLAGNGQHHHKKKAMMAWPNLCLKLQRGKSGAKKGVYELLLLSSNLYGQEGFASSCTLQNASASADLASNCWITCL